MGEKKGMLCIVMNAFATQFAEEKLEAEQTKKEKKNQNKTVEGKDISDDYHNMSILDEDGSFFFFFFCAAAYHFSTKVSPSHTCVCVCMNGIRYRCFRRAFYCGSRHFTLGPNRKKFSTAPFRASLVAHNGFFLLPNPPNSSAHFQSDHNIYGRAWAMTTIFVDQRRMRLRITTTLGLFGYPVCRESEAFPVFFFSFFLVLYHKRYVRTADKRL